jgi:branched-chain amino acid transport system substrate-binding protein
MLRSSTWILGFALFLIASCGGSAREVATSGNLKVGVILPMTGDQATYGEESWNGIQLAMEDLKNAGLPHGIEWDLILKDEASEKKKAGANAKLLIENEGVHILLGSVASSNTTQIAVEAKESEVPLITPASTNDKVTIDGGSFVSRICYKDSFQAEMLATFAWRNGWKKAAVVVDKSQLYSTGLADFFEKSFKAKGGSTHKVFYTTQDTEFENVILNVAAEKPDVIFISGYYGQGGPMIRQAGDRWKGIPVLAGDGWDSPDLIPLIGESDAKIFISTHFAADAPDERVQAFAQRYKSRFGKLPGAMAALGYDVMFVLADAVKRCENPRDWNALAKAILETTGVKCITGTIDLTTPDRTPRKSLVFVKVDGGLKYHETVKPD